MSRTWAKCEAVRQTVETDVRRIACVHIWSQTLSAREVGKEDSDFWVGMVSDCEGRGGEDVALSCAIAAKHMKAQDWIATSSYETS